MSIATRPPAAVNPLGNLPGTLAEAETALRRQLFTPGCPAQLTEESARIDARFVGRLRCPACGKRRLEYHPWHRRSEYRVLAGCPTCGAAEEV